MLVGQLLLNLLPLVSVSKVRLLYFVHIYVRDFDNFFVYHSNVVITMYTAPIHDTFPFYSGLNSLMFLTQYFANLFLNFLSFSYTDIILTTHKNIRNKIKQCYEVMDMLMKEFLLWISNSILPLRCVFQLFYCKFEICLKVQARVSVFFPLGWYCHTLNNPAQFDRLMMILMFNVGST